MMELFILTVTVLVLYYYWKSTYWKRKGITAPAPLPLVGNMLDYVLARKHYGEVYEKIYKSHPTAKFVGIYRLFNEPAILIRDLDLMKTIFIMNFNSFHDNYILTDHKMDPLADGNPFIAKGNQWKILRSQIGQVFTPTKIKAVFPVVTDVCKKFVKYVADNKSQSPLEVKSACAKYTIEVIATAGFGLEAQAFTNPHSYFTTFCDEIFAPHSWSYFQNMGMNFSLWLAKVLKTPYIPTEVQNWLVSIVKDMIATRKLESQRRNDFFETILNSKDTSGELINEETVYGHASTLLLEGFETSSSLMAYCLYELTQNSDVLKKVQREIDTVYEKNNNTLNFDAISEMTYLDSVLLETLRMHPAMLATVKQCTEDTTFPPQYSNSSPVQIPKGAIIVIPVLGVHYDPDIYPDPNVFNPDRFSEESLKIAKKCSFLAFGEGPRICIGMRFGLAQSKAGLASLLKNYNIKLSPKTKHPIKLSATTFLSNAHGGIWVDFEMRNE